MQCFFHINSNVFETSKRSHLISSHLRDTRTRIKITLQEETTKRFQQKLLKMSSISNLPMDFREMDVLRFFFELNRQQIDPQKLQQILLQHQMQNPLPQQNFSPIFKPKDENISTPSTRVVIPEPKIVFQYVPSPKFATPEPKLSSDEDENDDYKNVQRKKSKEFQIEDRCNFINLKEEQNRCSLLMTPTSIAHESDRESENEQTVDKKSHLPKLVLQSKLKTWPGSSIYHNLPEIVMGEFDKILRESHEIKHVVVEKLNQAFPVSYDYNPKKSRIRTNYYDPQIAEDRTKNNVASRRSRQRKKFLTHVHQYSVDYDYDENKILSMQAQWLKAIISSCENKNLEREEELLRLRKQCGFN